MTENQCLVGIETAGVKSWDLLADSYISIQKFGHIEKTSCVYQLRNDEAPLRKQDPNRNLSVVLEFKTPLSPQELALLLSPLSTQIKFLHDRKLMLLAYEDLFLMTPDLTLPHPELHAKEKWLIPAAEICGQWKHPVLNLTLEQIAKPVQYKSHLEFYSQGKALLDFSSTKN